jgi:hypothetical protein
MLLFLLRMESVMLLKTIDFSKKPASTLAAYEQKPSPRGR